MARNSISTGDLYFKLGLDLSELDKDFVNAKNTVRTNIGKLKGEQFRIRLQMDIDTAKLGPAAKQAQKLAVQEKALTRELDLQRQVVGLAKAEYDAMAEAKGKNSRESERLQTKLLKEQKTMANMQGKLTAVQTGASLTPVDKLTGSFEKLQSTVLKVSAVAAAGTGIYNFVKGAKDAGEAVYGLHERLGITVDDAERLNTMLRLSGVSGESFTRILVRLNKQVLTAGDKGNVVTGTLQKFGVSLTDASGHLLPMNEELARLAEGYQKAAATGQQEAYITQVLGDRGQALVELLREYSEIQERTAKIKGGSIMDPEEAHQLALDWQDMGEQLDKLSQTMGSALLPALKELIPSLQEAAAALADFAKANPQGTSAGIGLLGKLAAGAAAMKGASLIAGGLGAGAAATAAAPFVGGAIAAGAVYSTANDYKQSKLRAATKDILGRDMGDGDAYLRLNSDTGQIEKQTAKIDPLKRIYKLITQIAFPGSQIYDPIDEHAWEATTDKENEAIEAGKKKENAENKAAKASIANAEAKKQAEKEFQERLKNEQKIREDNFKLSHSDLVNSLLAIEQETKAYEKQGLDKTLIAQNAAIKKAQVMEDYETNVVDKLNSVWNTELENRLKQIETEKKAWLKKGADEVSATKWAEKEKQDAVRNAALEAIKNDRKRLEELRSAMSESSGGGFVSDNKGNRIDIKSPSRDERLQALSQEWLAEDREKLGIKPGDTFPAELIEMYQKMQKYKENQLVPGLEGMMPVPQLAQVGQGSTKNYNVENPVINVNIDNPVVRNESELAALADQVAKIIQPAVIEALGGMDNGY